MNGSPDHIKDIRRLMPDLTPLQRCGEGSYGAVYVAQDATGRHLAVKYTLFDDQGGASREQDGLNFFCRKMRGVQNLIAVHHVVANGKELCYTMDLADDFRRADGNQEDYCADTLERRISSGPRMPLEDIVRYARQLMDAVEALHAEGLVHRDIKPANVLFVNGTLKLGDVGLVSQAALEPSVVGTPSFMPPEMRPSAEARANGHVGFAEDLYALGITLYCMMSGREAKDYPTLPAQIIERERELGALNAFINHACASDPDGRFANIREFREAFETQVCKTPTAASRARHRRLVVAVNLVIGLVLVTAVGTAFALWRAMRTTPAPTPPVPNGLHSQLPWWTEIPPDIKDAIVVCAERADGEGTVPPGWSLQREGNALRISLDRRDLAEDIRDNFEVYLQFSSGTALFTWEMAAGEATLSHTRLFSSQGFWPAETEARPVSAAATPWGLRFLFQGGRLRAYANGRQLCNMERPATDAPWRLVFRLVPQDGLPATFEEFCLFAPTP